MKSLFDPQKLTKWFEKNQRDFPWRRNPEPYWVWLAEVMSQQTQMSSLLPYFKRFTERFKTLRDLAKASEEEVMGLWAGLGYYSRARNLHQAAKVIHQNGFPKSATEWQELPGVGPYTAAAIASQTRKENAVVFDGNVLRVCARLTATKNPHNQDFKSKTLLALSDLIHKVDPSSFNQGLMELGAIICIPKKPACLLCPIQISCLAFKTGEPEKFPAPKKRKEKLEIKVKSFVLIQKNKVLLIERKKPKWFSGLWDFPSELGGVREPIQKIKFKDEYSSKFQTKHNITHHEIWLTGLVVKNPSPAVLNQMIKGESYRWVQLDALTENLGKDRVLPLPLATTAKKILKTFLQSQP